MNLWSLGRGVVPWKGRSCLIQDVIGLKGCPSNALETFGNPGSDESQGRVGDEVCRNYW